MQLLVLIFALVGLVHPAAGQTTGTGAVSGLVLDESGHLRPGVAVRARPDDTSTGTQDSPRTGRVVIADAHGVYAIDGLVPGAYVLDVLGDQFAPSGTRVDITGSQTVTHHIVSRAGSRWISLLVVFTILAYATALLAFRHHNIVRTNRELLCAQLENIGARIPLEADPAQGAAAAELRTRVHEIWQAVVADLTWREWFFWSRGREIGAWTRLHEVERQLVTFLVPDARVIERAVTAEADLRKLGSASATALADRLRVTLQPLLGAGAPCPPDGCVREHLKQQLAEALTLTYGESDTRFATLMEWHNKAMWMVYLALLVIMVVGLVFHHEELFLVGAAGGLMSRMARSLFREDVPSDYGASWTTLFLSPLLGAISSWFGIAHIMWLTTMQVLGAAEFGLNSWDRGPDAVLLAMGFALGFSERLFTSLLSAVEGKVTTGLSSSAPRAAPVPPLPMVPSSAPPPQQGTAAAPGPQGETREDRLMHELDLQAGERVAFIGDATSAARSVVAAAVGADHVIDVTDATLTAAGPFDGVLIEAPLSAAAMTSLAAHLVPSLNPDGRVVVVGRTPAALFEGDAATQRTQDHAGPALVKDVMTLVGLGAQEPPVRVADGDPVEWIAGFVKPAAGGDDR
ncbi:MAG: carboxypeptidase-like regulatory domain-containing protein [Vicinamibacterales bacterium]